MKHRHYDIATSIVKSLQDAGYIAMFAGGWVRDFLLGLPSQDIDIATNAHPEEVMRLFPKSIAVGAQFGVVRIIEEHLDFEVATFRSDAQYVDGRRPSKVNLHSSPEEDAQRRDFTINGMFYDPIRQVVYDFVGGRADLNKKIIRTIGCPLERFREDRLRIIRAIRFKHVFRFSIEDETWRAMCQESEHVPKAVSKERVWQELQKMLDKGALSSCLQDMHATGLLHHLFPTLRNLDETTIADRIDTVKRCADAPLAAAMSLLFLGTEYLKTFASEYHLSKREEKIIDCFLQYNRLEGRYPDTFYVKAYAKPEFWEYLKAVSCLRSNKCEFLRRHMARREALSFWVEQVCKNSFLVSGKDLEQLLIPSGMAMGKILKDVFTWSVLNKIQDKSTLLEWVKEHAT